MLHGLQQEPLQGANIWWTDGREREAEQLEHTEERRNGRLEGGEEKPAVSSLQPPGAMAKSQPVLALRPMSGSMSM